MILLFLPPLCPQRAAINVSCLCLISQQQRSSGRMSKTQPIAAGVQISPCCIWLHGTDWWHSERWPLGPVQTFVIVTTLTSFARHQPIDNASDSLSGRTDLLTANDYIGNQCALQWSSSFSCFMTSASAYIRFKLVSTASFVSCIINLLKKEFTLSTG